MIHRGHIDYLRFCRAQGDVVVVGLNSDTSVRALKGPERPINNQYDRAAVLSGLETVDLITIFDDPSVLGLVKQVRPDVLVKGGDWGGKQGVVGWEFVESYGGKVMLAPLVEGQELDLHHREDEGIEGARRDGGIDPSRIREALETHKKLVAEFERSALETIVAAAETIVQPFRNGGTLYLCGNGGSAADAQHIAGEMVGRFRAERRALPAVALSTDTSVLTCIGNDYCLSTSLRPAGRGPCQAGRHPLGPLHERGLAQRGQGRRGRQTQGCPRDRLYGQKGQQAGGLADICLCADAQATAAARKSTNWPITSSAIWWNSVSVNERTRASKHGQRQTQVT